MFRDHSKNAIMKEIAISEFKAKCLTILEEVRKTGRPIRVTRFGESVAEVVPPSQKAKVVSHSQKRPKRRLGSMAGTMKITGDIVGSISNLNDEQ